MSYDSVDWMSQGLLLPQVHHASPFEGTHITIEQFERLWARGSVNYAQGDDMRESYAEVGSSG